MVNVSHDCNNRGARSEVFFFIFVVLFLHFELLLHVDKFDFVTKFISHQLNHLSIQSLIDGHHQTEAHTFSNNFRIADIHQIGKFTHTDEFGKLQLVILNIFSTSLLGHFIPFRTAVFSFKAFTSTPGAGKFRLSFPYFVLYFFLINFLCFARNKATALNLWPITVFTTWTSLEIISTLVTTSVRSLFAFLSFE